MDHSSTGKSTNDAKRRSQIPQRGGADVCGISDREAPGCEVFRPCAESFTRYESGSQAGRRGAERSNAAVALHATRRGSVLMIRRHFRRMYWRFMWLLALYALQGLYND